MSKLNEICVAILATDGFEQSELLSPRNHLEDQGATVVVVAPSGATIRGWDGDEWGGRVEVNRTLDEANADSFHALILPGGLKSPDSLRTNEQALAFVKAFFNQGKVVAAICHAPWVLINAGVVVGRSLTSYPSLRMDLENAGAKWHDKSVVTDNGVVTSRSPSDLEEFNDTIVREIIEGQIDRAA